MLRFGSLPPLLLLLTFCVGVEAAQRTTTGKSLGLVVLSEKYPEKGFIRFYNEDESLWYEFTFYYDDSDGKFEYANESFSPFAFSPDYFLLALKCVGKEAGRYKVIVNEETGLKKYVKADDPSLKFEAWEEHVLGLFSVDVNWKENPLLEAPRGRAKKVAAKVRPLHPVAVRGEWLKVKWPVAESGEKYDFGWVRWRRGERLLVEFFYYA